MGIENLDSEVKDRSQAMEKMQHRVEMLVLVGKSCSIVIHPVPHALKRMGMKAQMRMLNRRRKVR